MQKPLAIAVIGGLSLSTHLHAALRADALRANEGREGQAGCRLKSSTWMCWTIGNQHNLPPRPGQGEGWGEGRKAVILD